MCVCDYMEKTVCLTPEPCPSFPTDRSDLRLILDQGVVHTESESLPKPIYLLLCDSDPTATNHMQSDLFDSDLGHVHTSLHRRVNR